MDYQKIYNQLINQAKNKTIVGYSETHHIVPRCLGGTDDPANLVDLTPEEHYVAHQLLVKIHKDNKKILSAAVMMCSNRVNNKLYGWLRRRFSMAQSKAMAGSGNNMFDKRWVSNETETKLVENEEAIKLLDSGNYIAGKMAVRASCGCLVKKRCNEHNSLKEIAYDNRRVKFKRQAKELFEEFIQSDVKSITQFAKIKNTSQPALTQFWKKHIPEYSTYVAQGKSFKKNLTIK
jgi:ribosomal protein S17E